MKVLDFIIPVKLQWLIENSKWKKENFKESFKVLIPDYDFYFEVNGLVAAKIYFEETFPMLYSYVQTRNSLSLAKDLDKERLGSNFDFHFNIERALTIGGSSADDALLLDYQNGYENPRVLITDFSYSPVKYICIANNFDEFCEKFIIDYGNG